MHPRGVGRRRLLFVLVRHQPHERRRRDDEQPAALPPRARRRRRAVDAVQHAARVAEPRGQPLVLGAPHARHRLGADDDRARRAAPLALAAPLAAPLAARSPAATRPKRRASSASCPAHRKGQHAPSPCAARGRRRPRPGAAAAAAPRPPRRRRVVLVAAAAAADAPLARGRRAVRSWSHASSPRRRRWRRGAAPRPRRAPRGQQVRLLLGGGASRRRRLAMAASSAAQAARGAGPGRQRRAPPPRGGGAPAAWPLAASSPCAPSSRREMARCTACTGASSPSPRRARWRRARGRAGGPWCARRVRQLRYSRTPCAPVRATLRARRHAHRQRYVRAAAPHDALSLSPRSATDHGQRLDRADAAHCGAHLAQADQEDARRHQVLRLRQGPRFEDLHDLPFS